MKIIKSSWRNRTQKGSEIENVNLNNIQLSKTKEQLPFMLRQRSGTHIKPLQAKVPSPFVRSGLPRYQCRVIRLISSFPLIA